MTEKRLRYMRAFLVGSSEFVIDDDATHERLKRYDILDRLNELNDENEQLKKQIERIDFILDDLNGAESISRDDGIKALNKIDKVIGKR